MVLLGVRLAGTGLAAYLYPVDVTTPLAHVTVCPVAHPLVPYTVHCTGVHRIVAIRLHAPHQFLHTVVVHHVNTFHVLIPVVAFVGRQCPGPRYLGHES